MQPRWIQLSTPSFDDANSSYAGLAGRKQNRLSGANWHYKSQTSPTTHADHPLDQSNATSPHRFIERTEKDRSQPLNCHPTVRVMEDHQRTSRTANISEFHHAGRSFLRPTLLSPPPLAEPHPFRRQAVLSSLVLLSFCERQNHRSPRWYGHPQKNS